MLYLQRLMRKTCRTALRHTTIIRFRDATRRSARSKRRRGGAARRAEFVAARAFFRERYLGTHFMRAEAASRPLISSARRCLPPVVSYDAARTYARRENVRPSLFYAGKRPPFALTIALACAPAAATHHTVTELVVTPRRDETPRPRLPSVLQADNGEHCPPTRPCAERALQQRYNSFLPPSDAVAACLFVRAFLMLPKTAGDMFRYSSPCSAVAREAAQAAARCCAVSDSWSGDDFQRPPDTATADD